ncbi:hypothetical protein MtrunA17_Chr2g0327191 [Medicago truncatula]|uniref:Uncharacterized protein n=1 Tax=Medicago truncatula TaxID=3880 RepID=A0A396JCL1_MEDTR|nr:hypothetical protein MtrunA17_Chr2g0327191 [Medicago truncatula]
MPHQLLLVGLSTYIKSQPFFLSILFSHWSFFYSFIFGEWSL